MNKYSILIIIPLIFFSCKEKEYKRSFPETKELKSEDIHLNEVIKFEQMYKTKDYVIIKDGFRNASVFFYVYKLPNLDFLYSFAERGSGPEEFQLPIVIKNTPENYFSFRDHGKDKLVTYTLTDTAAILNSIKSFPPKDECFLWEINYLNDSLSILKKQNNKWSRRELWNLHTNEIIDSIPNSFDIKKELGENYDSTFEDLWIISNNNKLAFGYYFMDLLEIGIIENNKIIINQKIGIDKIPEFHLYGPGKPGGKYQYNFLNNIVHYKYMTCDNENIYALYANTPFGEIDSIKLSTIEVYSWEGEPKAILKLDKSISDFIVDETSNSIYSFDAVNSEDFISKYKIK